MPLNPNMKAIETVTVPSGGQDQITFNDIPQTYIDLVILLSARTDRTGANIDGVYPFFNNDTIVGNYSGRRIIGNGSTATSNTYTGVITAANDLTTYAFGNAIIYIPNYRSANNKSFTVDAVNENNATIAYTTLSALLWNNTAPISTITLRTEDGVSKLLQHSTATLYGITSAGYGAYATGGVITETSTHWIHSFFSTGTFTPTQNLTADYLVVAGGGGAQGGGGGGGAGGLRSTVTASGGTPGTPESALSLTANTSYTVQVGGGGTGGNGVAPSNASGSNSYISGTGITTVTSTGGGGGADYVIGPGASGGSGGGGAWTDTSTSTYKNPGSGSPNQGYDGGSGNTAGSPASGAAAGGGGGAGGVGANQTSGVGGNGGAGVAVAISGSSVTYAGGGGGYGGTTAGAGGAGGGGSGNTGSSGFGTAGTANTGGGAGAGYDRPGKSGGSGIVIIRYLK